MKKILVVRRPGGAFGYITDGWINALRDKGHQVERWDGTTASWNAFQPDLYIGSSGHKQPLPSNPGCKIAMHVNPFGPVDCQEINEPEQSKEYIRQMRPTVVFGYGFEEDRVYWQHWKEKFGIPWVPMATAADKTIYNLQNPIEKRTLAAVYIGGKWAYKGKSIDAYLHPAEQCLRTHNHLLEIHGWGNWPTGVTLIDDVRVTPKFNAAKIAPCISELHTQKWGFDLPERIWKVAACGALPIHDPVPTLRQVLPMIPMGRDPKDYMDICLYFLQNDDERVTLAKAVHDMVMNNHTYHHRISHLFRALGWVGEAQLMVE